MSDDYTFIDKIGEGMYGTVYKAINKQENKIYAVKRLNFQNINEKEKKHIKNEVELIKNLKHPNVISYKDSFNDKDNYFNIVTIFCEGGDMYSKIQKRNGEFFNEEMILNWTVQILLGLNYIHKNGIIHRDIKPQNIFIKNENLICIGDFGIAKIINNQMLTQTMTSIIGTPLYMSPESFNEPNSKNFASDIWSTGCCLYEICNLKHAFGADRWETVFVKVREGKHPPVNKRYSTELRNIIESMLNVNPLNRPTIPQLLKSNFLRPKAAKYINDFIRNNKFENDEQIGILKEQADEFGIFKNKINTQIKEASIEKDKKVKKPNNKSIHPRRDTSNPISPQKNEKPKKFSLDKKNKMYDYDISNKNKKLRNKNIDYNFSGNNKYIKQGDYTSDDNKKIHKNKDNISPNYNNCHRVKSNFSNNKKKPEGRPLTSQKTGKNSQISQKNNISIINKKEKYNKADENFSSGININSKKDKNAMKDDNYSIENIKFLNQIEFNEHNEDNDDTEVESNNEINFTKEKLLNDRINYFKKKCFNYLDEKKYLEAYNYLVKIKRNNNKMEINNRDIRENLIQILGKDNIGFWHLIDQIILFEDMIKDN